MHIEIKFKDDTPLSMASHLVNEMAEQARLFDATHSVVVRFDAGEEERMLAVENNRAPRIKLGLSA